MTRGQILQIAGAVWTGLCVYFLTQITLYLGKHPKTDKKERNKKT